MHNNVKTCVHKWILISIAIEAAILEDSMTLHENARVQTYGNIELEFALIRPIIYSLKKEYVV